MILLISYGKWVISFNLPFKGKKLRNKRSCGKLENRYWSNPILGAILQQNRWFGALISCIILMGDVFAIPCKVVGAHDKNIILVLNNYLMLLYTFPELHTGNGKNFKLGNIFPH